MTTPKIATRLHVETGLAGGQSLGLDSPRAHFLRSVLRLRPGARLLLFNGRDGEWLGRLEGLGKGWASVEVLEQTRPQAPEPDLWLVFAPIKRARIDFVAEKATELGCSRLQPVLTRHTAVDRVNLQRLAANAREAAEQCRRLTLPAVRPPVALERLLAEWPAGRRLVVADESGAGAPAGEALSPDLAESWALLVGPEGGFAARERELLSARPFVTPVSLGPRILRADTAAVAGLALLQAMTGDWR